ncbi:MAG: hypothetical protein R3D57_11955 [Hyphomicrobiaceae bacterium]
MRTLLLFALSVVACLSMPFGAVADESKLRRFGATIDVEAHGEDRVVAGGAKVRVGGRAGGDVWIGGAEVTLDAEVVGLARIAGATVSIRGPVGGDLLAAGSIVEIANETGGDGRILAARATISGHFARSVEISAATVELTPEASVGGLTDIDAAKATLAGSLQGPLELHAQSARIDATVTGPAEITGFDITIGPAARFGSDLTIYSSAEPKIDPAAEVKGKLWVRPMKDSPMMRAYRDGGWIARARVALMIAAGGLLTGILFLWVGRGAVEDAIDRLVEETGWSGLVGALALLLVPVLVILLSITVVGLPLGVFLLLALPLALALGLAATGFGLGEFVLNREGEPRSAGARVLMLLIGLLILAVLAIIPYAGPPVAAIAVVFGFGAVLRAIRGRLRPAGEPS